MQRLKDKVAIITGGAGGIGKATAELFAAEGAKVAIWDINEDKGVATAEQIGGMFQKVNTTNLESVQLAAKEVVDNFGKIDILINNAGITRDATMKKMTSDQWQQVIDVNLTGVFNCTKAAYPFMAENGYGRIVSAASVVAHNGNFGQTNYVATKAGVIGMTKVWAKEFGRKGITANAVAPGFIGTEMVLTIPEKVINMLKEKTPLQRLGLPAEIAKAYLFLSSDDAAFITGTTLNVDGGVTL
ncbi:MAG: 3-oxoacyl-ACP reductase FabG [Bacteroidota bacterium]